VTGLGRALRGEWYAWTRRRSVRLAVAFVFGVGALRVVLARVTAGMFGSDGAAHANFWPRFAQGSRDGILLAELLALVILAGALPREVGLGAARDPLTRRVSRSAFLMARACAAALLPVALAVGAVLGAWLAAAALYDGGHIVSPGFGGDAGVQAQFETWTAELGLTPAKVAEWNELAQDTTSEEAFAKLGIEPFELPSEFYDYVPFLVFRETEVRAEVLGALLRGIAPLVALGLFALALSALLAGPALAIGLAVGVVLFFGVFLAPELQDKAWWVFADWLPGMGHESPLHKAGMIADGYSDVAPTEAAALVAGRAGAWAGSALFLILSLFAFRRKRL